MRWFKHFSDAHLNPKICQLIEKHGFHGYGIFWFLLELIALQVDEKDKFEVSYPINFLSRMCLCSAKTLTTIFNSLAEVGLLECKIENGLAKIKCPKMAVYS